jgi:HEAT repeat protein
MLALARIGSSEAIQALVRAAEPGGRFFRRKPVATRIAAVEALGRASNPGAKAALKALAGDDDPDVRRAAERSLEASG